MTDKQLALLLRQIAARIRAAAFEIEPFIESGATVTDTTIDWSSSSIMRGLKTVEEPRFAAVQHILDLAADIEDEAELLTPQPAAE